MPCTICHKSREGEPVYVHPDDDGIDGMHPTCAIEHVATLNEMLNGAEADNDTLRAQLAEAREAARTLADFAEAVFSLEDACANPPAFTSTRAALATVQKWEG